MVPVASDNREIIMEAAELVKARSPLDMHISAPKDWAEVDLLFPGQLNIRMTPVDDSSIDIEAFSYGGLIAGERLHKCRTPARVAEVVEHLLKRAIAPDG
jgi:hypothetical protein